MRPAHPDPRLTWAQTLPYFAEEFRIVADLRVAECGDELRGRLRGGWTGGLTAPVIPAQGKRGLTDRSGNVHLQCTKSKLL